MIKNYFRVAWRNIIKNKLFSIINILGLAIGLACSILILLWVQDELSFDKFHENQSRIYRVLQHMPFGEETTWAINQGPLAQTLEDEIPEIERAIRVSGSGLSLKYNEQEFIEGGIVADSLFFELFSFKLLHGDPNTALSTPLSIVLTETWAKIIFGDVNPLGKTVLVYDEYSMVVTGIVEDPPLNSHLDFEYVTTMAFGGQIGYSIDRWNNSAFYTYVLLEENTLLNDVNKKIRNVLDNKPTLEEGAKLSLQSLAAIHLSSGIEFENGRTGNTQYVKIFFTSAIFILLIACINFMNMSTAQATRRAKEVGLRKAIGAEKGQLVGQFILETTLLASLAFGFALLLIESVLPLYNEFSGKAIAIHYFEPTYIVGFLLLLIFASLLAGAYPAFYISSFLPIKVLKSSTISQAGNSGFRKVLVVLQFSISIILLIGTLVVYSQVNYMRNKDLGFDKQNLLYLRLRNAQSQLETLKNDLLMNPNIKYAAGASFLTGWNWANNQWKWEGKSESILFKGAYVDYDFFETFDMEIVEGRSYSKDFASDSLGVILNEAAIRSMGLEDPIGKTFTNLDPESSPYHILGIVKDYNYRPLNSEIEPLVLFLDPKSSDWLWLKVADQDVEETITYVESTWKKFDPDHELQYGFLDQRLENRYRQEERIGTILQAFSVLALLILCLGLYGLLGFTMTQRYREISIRKVFGAGSGIILLLLSKGYYRLMLIAVLIAVPVSNYIIRDWLGSFAFKTEVTPLMFLVPVLVLFFISSIIILGQSLKATKTNVAELLRNE